MAVTYCQAFVKSYLGNEGFGLNTGHSTIGGMKRGSQFVVFEVDFGFAVFSVQFEFFEKVVDGVLVLSWILSHISAQKTCALMKLG
jgi:hypothetical protein